MATITKTFEKKSFNTPDEVRTHEGARAEIVNLGENTLMRVILQPGWRWSTHLKAKIQSDSCQVTHLGYVLSGRMGILMDDGKEDEIAAGDAVLIAPGHDAWVVGDIPFVFLDFAGGKSYAR